MVQLTGEVETAYLPTSEDLKSGDSLFCITPPPPPQSPNPRMSIPPTPPLPRHSRQQIAFGHYMTSYKTHMGSKCAFIIAMTN